MSGSPAALPHVRDATLDDADAIGRIHVRCWRHAYAGMVPQALLDSLDEDAKVAQWRRSLGSERPAGAATLVAEVDGELAGFIEVGPSRGDDAAPELGVLYAVYLEPSQIARGVGRALIAAGMQRMREAGFTRARLDVLPANDRARRVYEAAGWRAEGEPWLVQHGEHELPHQRYVIEL